MNNVCCTPKGNNVCVAPYNYQNGRLWLRPHSHGLDNCYAESSQWLVALFHQLELQKFKTFFANLHHFHFTILFTICTNNGGEINACRNAES